MSIPSIIWSERESIRHITVSCISIVAGTTVGFILDSVYDIYPLVTILASLGVTALVIILLKNISIVEIRRLVKTTVNLKKT